MIENIINKTLTRYMEKNKKEENKENIILYHHITYGSHYKQEVQAVQKIVDRGAHPLEPYNRIILRTYSRPNYTSSLLMKNSTAPKQDHESQSNVVYHFTCPDEACRSRTVDYVGLTTQKLRNRMQQYRYKEAIHEHYIDKTWRQTSSRNITQSFQNHQ